MANIVLYIMVLFCLLGGIDRLRGNKSGLGERFEEGIIIVGKISIILAGAYPMFYSIENKLSHKLNKISKKTGLNNFSILGILSSLANCVPMLAIYS